MVTASNPPSFVDRVERLAPGLVGVTLLWTVAEGSLDLGPRGIGRLDDYAEALTLSRRVWETGAYPTAFVYPPTAVLARLALGSLGLNVSGVVWIVAMVAALYVALRTIDTLLGHPPLPATRTLLTVATAFYAVQWDFRSVNGNVLFLALALAAVAALRRGHDRLAAALFAFGVVWKLYPLVLFPFFVTRRPRAAGWGAAWTAALFIGVPTLVLGPERAWAWHVAWVGSLAATTAPDFPTTYHGYSTSVHTALVTIFGGPLPLLAQIAGALRAGCLVLGLAIAAWTGRRAPGPADVPGVGVALVLAVLASSMAQPAHGVVWLVVIAVGWAGVIERHSRATLLLLLAGWLVLTLAPPHGAKAVAFVVASVVWCLAAARYRGKANLYNESP